MKGILKNLVKIITYQENLDREGFILSENLYDRKAMDIRKSGPPGPGQSAGGGPAGGSGTDGDEGSHGGGIGYGGTGGDEGGPGGGHEGKGGFLERPRGRRRSPRKIKKPSPPGGPDKGVQPGEVSSRLDQNRRAIENLYGIPANNDIILREFTLGADPPVGAFMVFIDGMVDRAVQNKLLQDLMIFSGTAKTGPGTTAQHIMKSLLPGSQVKNLNSFDKITEAVNFGDTAFFFEGLSSALAVETKGWEIRPVDRPNTEQTITGPQEAFTENIRVNTGLVRKIVRSEKLYTEIFSIGTRLRSDAVLMYIKDLANPGLVAEVKKRISSIKVDFVTDVGMLEQLIEDSPYNLNPQTLQTERPDRVAAALSEGRVAVMLSGSPFALVAPITMYSQLHTGEETYLRWQYGTFLRYVRTLSFYLALLLPGSYLAIVLYHQEMVPTELLLAIAGNRERVPFPTVVEMLLMEFAFELVREAGLRIPGIIGSTIGIVGALILGQAAVQANIVSPILVILVAVTGLASFSIPSHSLAFAVRIYRFFYIIMGAMLGFYGITIVLYIQILLTVNLKSFGVPYLSPSGPRTHPGGDVVTRLPIFFDRRRPDYLNPRDDLKSRRDPRGWMRGEENGGEGRG